ncbi:hypothetical protein ACNI4H_22235 [Klebsiella aerogenes]|uniref:hypothetical protein n=1 Tax=Klebsiella aerogenes TaxID=548 RepID=UPI0009D4CE4A|nr:hypothetical protein BXQ27_28245 [Klebsiella aerogenes]HBQ0421853.1 hypothetical protein [Klebsiella aerogenes]HDU3682794.1 hypothetical protein [Klebsiella aerogenes]HDU3703415.1 hypothetical protein [Klebsiella aerogenes]HDU3713721.1 hypothetical protein [Klebsiella aerogenes]
MTINNFIQLVDIPDYRFDKRATDIEYGDIGCDCSSKTTSLLDAIKHISSSVFELSENKEIDKGKIQTLTACISDLAELAIATNKIAESANYLAGIKEGNHVS